MDEKIGRSTDRQYKQIKEAQVKEAHKDRETGKKNRKTEKRKTE
jgi:hypothetical protein